jgi:hypothetical protein
MDVRAGMKAHHASPAGAVARDKTFKGRREAKKRAYAADEPARAARAVKEQARADALVATLAELTELTEEETAALREGGQVGESTRRGVVARATDADLEAKGKAKEVKKRQQNRKHSVDKRKRKKAKVEGLMQDEARLMERAAGLLADLERGGSTVLDDDGAGAFPEDEERIKALDAAKKREQDKRKKKNLGMQWTTARKALAAKVLQRRVALLENRVAELEKELRARAAAA